MAVVALDRRLLAAVAVLAAVLTGCAGDDERAVAPPAAPSTTPPRTSEPPSPPPDPWEGIDRVNVLILGSDGGPNRRGERTDVMIVASVDTRTGNTALIGVPRNLQHVRFKPDTPMDERFPSGFPDFAYGIFTYAESHPQVVPGSDTPGADLLKETVGYNLGLTVDYYVLINMQGFRNLIDALGGVTIRVTQYLPIGRGDRRLTPKLYEDMDGYHTLWYARSRKSTSDYDRMERQRCVLGAIVRQIRPEAVLEALPALMRAGVDSLRTDIPAGMFPAFVTLAHRVSDAEIQGITLGPPLVSGTNPDWDVVQDTVADAIAQTADAVRTPDRPKAEARSGTLQSLDAVCQYS